jgi:PEP-CTERM motif
MTIQSENSASVRSSRSRRACRSLLLALGIFTVALGPAQAVGVNLNSLINNIGSPINVFLAAGTYTATPIAPPTPGALYTAWNAWGGDTSGCTGEVCTIHGWQDAYVIADTGSGDVPPNQRNLGLYDTAAHAFAHASPFQFTLFSAQTISFYIDDTILGDNLGGVSLDVALNATPLPGALSLFASGLGVFGLFGWRRKRKIASTAAV